MTSPQASATPLEMTPEDLESRLAGNSDLLVLDVRTLEEFQRGHIPGARCLAVQELSARVETLTPYRNRDIVVTCEHGLRAAQALTILREAGFGRLYHLAGDMAAWRAAKRPLAAD